MCSTSRALAAIVLDMNTSTDTVPPARWRPTWRLSLTDNLALLAGVMMTTGLPPFPWTGVLVPVVLAMLWMLMLQAEKPARVAWLFALTHQATLLYWMFFLDPAKSIPTRWLVPVQAIATVVYVAVFYLLLGWVFRLVRDRLGRSTALALMPALWIGMEILRTNGEMGFPWCLIGSAWIGTPLLPLAAVAGEIGLSLATALTGAALVVLIDHWRGSALLGSSDSSRPWRYCLVGSAPLLWIVLAVLTPVKATVGPYDLGNDSVERRTAAIPVAAVQANVAMRDKWDNTKIDSTIVPYTDLTVLAAESGAELVVWAETAVPAYLRYDAQLITWVRKLAHDNCVFLFTGFPDASRTGDGAMLRYNSSGLFDPSGMLRDQYAKHHLLPIGERMPFSQYLPFLAKVDVGQAEWIAGQLPAPIAMASDQGTLFFSGLICFESIFADLARQAVGRGSQVLINITNDGWFGNTAGPRQHAALSRVRAVECGVPLIRCANNGISMIVDPKGRIVKRVGLGRRGLAQATIEPGAGRTLFIRFGALPVYVFLIIWSVLAVFVTRRGRKTR